MIACTLLCDKYKLLNSFKFNMYIAPLFDILFDVTSKYLSPTSFYRCFNPSSVIELLDIDSWAS